MSRKVINTGYIAKSMLNMEMADKVYLVFGRPAVEPDIDLLIRVKQGAKKRIFAQIFSQKNFSKWGKKRKPNSIYWEKQIIIRNCISYCAKRKILTVSPENKARNTLQQTVRNDKNNRNDNNWSRLPKEDGSAIRKNLMRQATWNRHQMSIAMSKGRTSKYKRNNVHQPAFPSQLAVLLKT